MSQSIGTAPRTAVIVDDHAIFRSGLRADLDPERLRILGEAADVDGVDDGPALQAFDVGRVRRRPRRRRVARRFRIDQRLDADAIERGQVAHGAVGDGPAGFGAVDGGAGEALSPFLELVGQRLASAAALAQGFQVARALSSGSGRGVSGLAQGLQGGWGYDT